MGLTKYKRIITKFFTKRRNTDCADCHSYSYNVQYGYINSCDLEPHYKNKICPCVNCIVKVNCSEECGEYNEYEQYFGLYGDF